MRTSKAQPIPLATLVEDLSIYPRHRIDDVHVGALADALEAGAVLPPVVAEAKSKRIVDGWHRVRAYRRVLGAEGVIDVELREYKTDAEVLLDAVALNASHGRRLDRVDQVRIVAMGEAVGIADSRLAVAMSITPDKIMKLRIRIAEAPTANAEAVPGTLKIALKRPARHLSGEILTEEQVAAHAAAPGTSYLLVAHQLRDGLRYGLADRADDRLREALGELGEVIGEWLAAG